MAEIALNLYNRRLQCDGLGDDESRDLNDDDFRKFDRWTETYRDILTRQSDPKALLALGQEMYAWLDGDQGWLDHIVETCVSPLILEFVAPLRPDDEGRAFLGAPWELLADNDDHWAKRSDLSFIPVRRFGKRGTPPRPSKYRLSTVFMAASPRGVQVMRFGVLTELRFEEEEAAILNAAGTGGMDLVVEESGTLSHLEETLAFEKNVNVVHMSCHGRAEPTPCLLLEDDYGNRSDAEAKDVADRIKGNRPRLLFLSACETAAPAGAVNALAVDMLQNGLSAVLGWAGSVGDDEATRFAEGLYRRLSLGRSLQEAVAGARLQLLDADKDTAINKRPSRDWHLARLYLGPCGGGVLSAGKEARRRDAAAVHKAFLDQQNKKVPVAAPHEFVGRRRQIQRVLHAFRGEGRKGVFIHGVGRQGKSSLAARIALRMPDYRLIVLYGKYDELSILSAFADAGTDDKLRDFFEASRVEVKDEPSRFPRILQELLEKHFGDLKQDDSGGTIQRPALLVIDDFEQVLEERTGQPHRIKPSLLPAIRSVLLAFRNAETKSRLLFTSRYTFSLQHDGKDLAADLMDLSLPPMAEYEARKQASAKRRAEQDVEGEGDSITFERMTRIINAGLGNPGLQDMLFRLALENPTACDAAVEELQAFIDSGAQPNQEELLAFLENLAIERILSLLTPGESELLRLSSVFELPIPLAIFESFCQTAGLGEPKAAILHLLGLGLWDLHEDLLGTQGAAAALNPMVRPLAGKLEDAERETVVASLLPQLYTAWGGADGTKRPYPADHELARLAIIVGNGKIIRTTAAGGVHWLDTRNEHRRGAELGKEAIAILDAQGETAPVDLLRLSGEQAEFVGNVGFARHCFQRAVEALEGADEVAPEDLGAVLLAQGRRFVREGRPDEALAAFRKIQDLLSDDRYRRSRAVTLGDIARILVSKGQVNEAMGLHQEELKI